MIYQLKQQLYALILLLLFFLGHTTGSCVTINQALQTNTVSEDKCAHRQLQIIGERIVNKHGDPIQLRGIYTRAEWLHSEQEALWFKQWGVNFVRILLTYDKDYWLVINHGKKDLKKRCILREENLLEMDKKCNWLENKEIYFIIEIPWRWYGITQKLEKPQLLAEQCAAMYSTLAKRYKDMKYLIGFCMFSEIYVAPKYYADYKKICTTIVDAVHAVDPGFIVSATGTRVSSPDSMMLETLIERPNVIYDFHYYDVKSFVSYRPYYGDMRYPGRIPHGYSGRSYYLDQHLNKIFITPALSYSKRYQVPVWCGEFGAFNNAPDGSSDRWMRDVCRILEQNGIPWILWTWKEGNKDVPQLWKDMWQGKLTDKEIAISPHGGTFTDALSVRIDAWTHEGNVYYTLDGAEPNKSSFLYSGPFRLSKTTTIKAGMIGKYGEAGPVDTTVFKFGGLQSLHPTPEVTKGLRYNVYVTASEKIENLEYGEVESSGIAKDFNEVKLRKSQDKTIVYEGLINILKAGRYFFYPVSYGAYEVFIDEVLVNKHSATMLEYARTSPGIITLEAGFHRLKIIYSKPKQHSDGFELKLQRDSEPIKMPEKVEADMLYHVADEATPKKEIKD